MLTTHGSKGNTFQTLVWQDEEVITHDLLELDAGHSAIPVLFRIPFACQQTDDHDPYNMILWNLEVTTKTPGFGYSANFNVPVFKTSESCPISSLAVVSLPKTAPPRIPSVTSMMRAWPRRLLRAAMVGNLSFQWPEHLKCYDMHPAGPTVFWRSVSYVVLG